MLIHKALLKYGYSSFSLIILEYCDKDKCIQREQFYSDFFKPEYNTLKKAASLLGFRHTEEYRNKISEYNRTRIITEETKLKMSMSHMGEKILCLVKPCQMKQKQNYLWL